MLIKQVLLTPQGGPVLLASMNVAGGEVSLRQGTRTHFQCPAEPYLLERVLGLGPDVVASLQLPHTTADVEHVLGGRTFEVKRTERGWFEISARGSSVVLPGSHLHQYPIPQALRTAIERAAAPDFEWPTADAVGDLASQMRVAAEKIRGATSTTVRRERRGALDLATKRASLSELGVLKTLGGQQLLSDPATGNAIIALTDHQTKQMYTIESTQPRHIGDAQIRARIEDSKNPRVRALSVSLYGGNFGSPEALENTARCTAKSIVQPTENEDGQRPIVSVSLDRPRGEAPGPNSFTNQVAFYLREELSKSDDLQITIAEPKARSEVEAQAAEAALREERVRYERGERIKDTAELASNIIEAGLNAESLPPEAFGDVRMVELAPATRTSGERLIRADMPGDFVYIPLEAGIVGQPIGDATGFRLPPYVEVGATAIVRRGLVPPAGGGVEITRNADVWNGSKRPIKLLMIPAATYMQHWHRPFSESEFATATRNRRRYESLTESTRSVHTDFLKLRTQIEAADPATSDFRDLSDRLIKLEDETSYLLKQYELLPRSSENRQALKKMDVVRKQIASAREFLRHFSQADGAASVQRLHDVLDPQVKGMSPDALLRVLRILLGRHASADKVGAPNQAHVTTVNDGVMLYVADLLGQLGQDVFDFFGQTTLLTDIKAKGRFPGELLEMETATLVTLDGRPLSTGAEIWEHVQKYGTEWAIQHPDQFNPWADPRAAELLFGVLLHGVYTFDVVRQALEPKYGLAKAKEAYEGVVMHHLTNSFIEMLFDMAGLRFSFEVNKDCFPPGRAELCQVVEEAALKLSRKMRPAIQTASRAADAPPAVAKETREVWGADPDANIIREYLQAAPKNADEDHLIARLQSIFDDVQQMTLLGLPKWVDIAYNMNIKTLKTNRDLLVALARGPVQEYGETNLMRGYGPLYVDVSHNGLALIGIEHVDRHPTDPKYSYYFQLASPGTVAHSTFAKTIAADPTLRAAYGKPISSSFRPQEQRQLVSWFLDQSVNPTDIKRLLENVVC